MSIRACELADIAPTAALAARMGRSEGARRIAQRMGAIRRRRDHRLCVCESEGKVVGYAWAQDYGPHLRTGESVVRIHDLFVLPAERRRGIGRELFRDVCDWAARRGAHYLQWQASPEAMTFYRALGFEGDPCPDPGHPFFELVLGGTPGP